MRRRAPLLTALAIALVVVGAYVGWKVWKRQRTLDTRIAERRVAGAGSSAAAVTAVEECRRWGGARGEGVSGEALPAACREGGPRPLWAADVGIGYASPVAAG